MPGFLIGILLLLTATSAAAQGSAVTGSTRGPEVRSVEVVGAGAVEPEVILRVLATRASRCRSPLLVPACALGIDGAILRSYLDEAELRADEERLQALHLSFGYPAARVNAEVNRLPRGGVAVRFITWPGEPLIVRSVQIRGLEDLPDRVELPSLPIVPGDRLGLGPLETAQRIIAGRLAADGYAFAQVGVPGSIPEAGGPYDLVLEVRPGPLAVFGTTTFHVQSPLTASDAREYLAYESGERFSPAALERTVERLYRVPIVERVQVQPAPSEEGDNRVDIDIFVTTGEPRGLQLEGAISSSACVAGVTGWTDRYFLDRPRTVSVSAGASNLLVEPLRRFPCAGAGQDDFAKPDYFLRGDLTQPLGPDTWMNIGGGFSRESSPRAYIQSGVIARVSLVHELRRGLDVVVAY
jgi:outer membrane protein assembly factor BamA